MRTRFYCNHDGWTADGHKISSPENLDAIRKCLENQGPVIVEHWFYRGSCAPERFVFDDFDAFLEYLDTKAFAGDALHVWNFAETCRDDNELAYGKCPDDGGMVPQHGAY